MRLGKEGSVFMHTRIQSNKTNDVYTQKSRQPPNAPVAPKRSLSRQIPFTEFEGRDRELAFPEHSTT